MQFFLYEGLLGLRKPGSSADQNEEMSKIVSVCNFGEASQGHFMVFFRTKILKICTTRQVVFCDLTADAVETLSHSLDRKVQPFPTSQFPPSCQNECLFLPTQQLETNLFRKIRFFLSGDEVTSERFELFWTIGVKFDKQVA